MKLKITALSMALTLLATLSSCGKSDCKPIEPDKNLSCHAEITHNDITYSADLERQDGMGWKATFTAPQTVDGLEISLFDSSCTLDFKGLSYSAQRSELPQGGMVTLLTAALDNCINGKVKCVSDGQKVLQRGEVEGMEFSALFDSGKLESLEIFNNLTAKFT